MERRLPWTSLLWLASLLVIATADKTAADYYVHSLPGAPSPALRSWAGHVEVTPEHNGNMFFWLYKNRHIANRQRLVLWLNGGPGCSSMDGAMMEIGPYRVNPDKQTLRLHDGSWDEFANVLFVDNPVGTGFSYVDSNSYVTELSDMAAQMITFLEKWFAIFPEHAQDDLYLAGESYAGQHIPYIASAILERNAKVGNAWNLSGLLIGNGWISGSDQYPAYLKYAKANGIVAEGSSEAARLEQTQAMCDAELAKGAKDHIDNGLCEGILNEILSLTKQGDQCYNMYDTRLKDAYPSCGMNWPPDLEYVTPYLRREDVVRALHINPDKKTGWTECNDQVGGAFRARESKPSYTLLPGLLAKIPIVLFSGDKDLICNHLGTEELISNLEWNGGRGMESDGVTAPRRDWTFEGEPAGIYQEARNLTYIRFYNSSHMVPFDYPRRTRDMLDRFMGVDIGSIGGQPADSLIDGEKTPSTSVGGHPNSTAALEEEAAALQKATWAAYRRSAEVALFLLIVILVIWGIFYLRERRRRAGYKGLFGSDPYDGPGDTSIASGLGLDGFGSGRRKSRQSRDIEAAAAFDEAELDELTTPPKTSHERFVDSADDADHTRSNGHAP